MSTKTLSEDRGELQRDSTTFAEAKAGRKNILINPNMEINQRLFDGNWSLLAAGAYGWDRWRKVTDSIMEQPVLPENYAPNTVYTLSGTGVVTQQMISPSSGFWNVQVPVGATNLQLERGEVATAQEERHIELEIYLCKTYYGSIVKFYRRWDDSVVNGVDGGSTAYEVRPRVVPAINLTHSGSNSTGPSNVGISITGVTFAYTWLTSGPAVREFTLEGTYDAEVHV